MQPGRTQQQSPTAASLQRCTQSITNTKFATDMSICKFCGQKAGLFNSVHKECKAANDAGKVTIVNKVSEAIVTAADFPTFEAEVNNIAQSAYIKKEELGELYSLGFDKAVETFLEDDLVSPEEEEKISNFKSHSPFDDSILDKQGSLQKIVKSLILRDVFDEKIPARINVSGTLPFLFQKDESLIWVFQNVEFYEQRTKTTYQGRSQGVSVKVAKGLYYRTGSFKGNPVTSQEMTLLGSGILALTNKNLYFASSAKTFKTPYNKIVSINQYSDGIGIQKDGVSSKPQIFKDLDGWFAYNLISNLNKQ